MSILIDLVLGNHAAVFDDLVQIVRCDPGLSTWQPTQFVLQVAYQQKQQSVTSSKRILALVNAPQNILIIGVDTTYAVNGVPISAYFGGCTLPGSLTVPITTYLDVTEAAGLGYNVVNADRQSMPMPRPVLLYHELAHAYHISVGDTLASEEAQQVQAIHDENEFRAQVFIELRNSTNDEASIGVPSHQGYPFPLCKPTYPGFNWDCIVASTASGSPHASRVNELRRARREYQNLSLWATLIAEPVLDLYRQFSPGVVRDMNRDPELRQAMLLYIVQPIFHLVELAETYLRAESENVELMTVLDRSVDEYLSGVSNAGLPPHTLAAAAGAAAFAARAIGPDRAAAPVSPNDGEMPQDLYRYVASAIASAGRETAGYAWAFEGIGLFLVQAEARRATHAGITPAFLDTLGTWMARLPIPTDAFVSIADARDELKVFAERVFIRPHTRAQFAQHLLARWPVESTSALHFLLRDLQYLRPGDDTAT